MSINFEINIKMKRNEITSLYESNYESRIRSSGIDTEDFLIFNFNFKFEFRLN